MLRPDRDGELADLWSDGRPLYFQTIGGAAAVLLGIAAIPMILQAASKSYPPTVVLAAVGAMWMVAALVAVALVAMTSYSPPAEVFQL